jgi:prephenate dehydrogenase
MAKFKKIAIIGVGLIGGSIGLAIRRKKIAREVIGVFRHRSTMKKALKYRAVDKGAMDIREGVKDARLVILATPVHSIPVLAAEAARFMEKGAIITDAGSTKEWIVGEVEKVMGRASGVFFVGSHPMAGSERTGVRFAKGDLFEDSPCIVTKTARTSRKAIAKITDFWKSLGGKVSIMSPAEHDRTVSLISHLPHVVAFSLAGAVPGKEMACAAEGFKDTTRVASSDPELWADIFLTNKKAILKAGSMFEKYYRDILKAISKGDYRRTVRMLANAKSKRDRYIHGKEK